MHHANQECLPVYLSDGRGAGMEGRTLGRYEGMLGILEGVLGR